MKKKALLGLSLFAFACGGGGSEGMLADFETVIFSSTGAVVDPAIVPLLKAEVGGVLQLQGLKACLGDTNGNGRCDSGETGCRTCRDVEAGTPCDGGDFRSVCCAAVDVCFWQPTEFTITFNFRSVPSPNVSGGIRPNPTSPVVIQGYTATFNYSTGCPTGLSLIESEGLSTYVPAPPRDGESTAEVKVSYSTQPWVVSEAVYNACMSATQINFSLPPTFTSGLCKVDGLYNFTVMEQYTGKKKTVAVPVSFQFIPTSGRCVDTGEGGGGNGGNGGGDANGDENGIILSVRR